MKQNKSIFFVESIFQPTSGAFKVDPPENLSLSEFVFYPVENNFAIKLFQKSQLQVNFKGERLLAFISKIFELICSKMFNQSKFCLVSDFIEFPNLAFAIVARFDGDCTMSPFFRFCTSLFLFYLKKHHINGQFIVQTITSVFGPNGA